MNKSEKNALKECLPLLAENMKRNEVLIFLISKHVLSFVDQQKIEAKEIDYEKNSCLIEILTKTGRESFQFFIQALHNSDQEYLADEILTALKKPQQKAAAEQNSSSRFRAIRNFTSRLFSKSPVLLVASDSTLDRTQEVLKKLYSTSFQKVNPFSLPFTFDIENTWVSLAFTKNWSEAKQNGPFGFEERRIENHCEMMHESFKNGKQLLVIEGRAASGKTSLMRRIAYDWAVGKLHQYKFVFYAEFRKIKKQEFSTIADLINDGLQHVLEQEDNIEQITQQMKNRNFCTENQILVLLDGFDEAQVKVPCTELSKFLSERGTRKPLSFHLIISTRPGPLSKQCERHDILNSATVLGFDRMEQKMAYIRAHFHGTIDGNNKISDVEQCLKESPSLNEIAVTPLFLVFICLVYDKIEKKTVFELYRCIIWWLIDRYQADNQTKNVPKLFGFDSTQFNEENWRIIQDHFLEFPFLRQLSIMAFELYGKNNFSKTELDNYKMINNNDDVIVNVGFLRREEILANFRMQTQFVFPHRTVQEFLAGGVYYFWPDTNTADNSLCKAIFAKDIKSPKLEKEYADETNYEMNEMEKFIWRAGLSSDNVICSRLDTCFQKYEALSLNISSVLKEAESVTQINRLLSMCNKASRIRFLCTEVLQVAGPFAFGDITCLQSLIFYGPLYTVPFSPEKSNIIGTLIFDLPKNNIFKEIAFHNFSFVSAQCFISTIHYLASNMNFEAEILFINTIMIYFNGVEGVHYISFEQNCSAPQSDLIVDHSSMFHTVLNCLRFANELKIEATPERHVRFEVRFPSLPKLTKLQFNGFAFLEVEEMPFSKLIHLEHLEFFSCEFDLSVFQALMNDICYHCTITNMEFSGQTFPNEDYFVKFLRTLQQCKSLDKLKIFWSDVSASGSVIPLSNFNATKTVCELVKNLQRLKHLTISGAPTASGSYPFIVDKRHVKVAAIPRKEFIVDVE